MAGKIIDNDRGYRRLKKAIEDGAKASVLVGLLAEKAMEPKTAGSKPPIEGTMEADGQGFLKGKKINKKVSLEQVQEPQTLTLLEVALVNEFGNDRIPERSFLRGWCDENEPAIKKRIQIEFVRVLQGRQSRWYALERIGMWSQAGIQKRITERIPPPNAPMTIRKKGSDVPLVDTGQLRASISFKEETS